MLKARFLCIILALVFASCNPFISKDLRKKNRCNNKIEREQKRHKKKVNKIKADCPEASFVDTIKVPFEVLVPKIEIKDSIQIVIDSNKVDSLVIELDKLQSKDEKVKYITKFIKDNFVLDTLIIDSLYTMRLTIVNGVLIPNITINERKIEGTASTTVELIKEIDLTLWEKVLNFFGGVWKYGLITLIILFILFILYKIIRKFIV